METVNHRAGGMGASHKLGSWRWVPWGAMGCCGAQAWRCSSDGVKKKVKTFPIPQAVSFPNSLHKVTAPASELCKGDGGQGAEGTLGTTVSG